MPPEHLTERAPDDDRVALFPDLSFEEALAAILAVDPRKAGPGEASDDEHPN